MARARLRSARVDYVQQRVDDVGVKLRAGVGPQLGGGRAAVIAAARYGRELIIAW